ncbi:DUF6545 domain-containing protein [Streptomyces sp. NPDC047972]|uniref:DUF6545 domain-containing protein n=1 Tax=Streptomyces sp. NPDC047972 TaxID=3365493 RepID=UPI003719F475
MNLYIPAAALGLVLLVKLPSLLRRWRTPLVRSVNTVIFLQAAAFFFSAPPTISAVNAATGISNFSAVLVFCMLSAYACACRVLMENWREDAQAQPRSRRRVRHWIWGHTVVAALIIVCFALGDAPVERRSDFETYYAGTPWIREMTLLCVLACIGAQITSAVACWTWARDIRRAGPGRRTPADGSLLFGLTVLTVGFLSNVTYGVAKVAAVVAAWTGRDWEWLNQAGLSLAGLGTVLVAAGFLIPIVAPWLGVRVFGPLRALYALGALRRAVSPAGDGDGRMRLRTPWYAGPGRRLTDRMTEIHDRMLELGAHCSEEVRATACASARRGGATEAESVAVGLAAMFTAAAEARSRGVPADKVRGAVAVRALRVAEAEYGDLLVSISRAVGAAPATPHRVPAGPADGTGPARIPLGDDPRGADLPADPPAAAPVG